MNLPLYLLLPLAAAIIFALSTLFLKRALQDGVRLIQSVHVSNFMVGAVTIPLFFFQREPVAWDHIYQPLLVSCCFFAAGVATVIAIRRGDVSLVTPLMGTKVVFVALGSVIALGEVLPPSLIFAAILTAAGILVLGIPDMKGGRNFGITTLYALGSAGLFGICDLMVQTWAPGFGRLAFIAVTSNGVALISLLAILRSHLPTGKPFVWPSGPNRYWIWMAALFVGLQAVIVGIALATFHDATGINVVYASRGLWAIALVALVGNWFGNTERSSSGKLYIFRVVGTIMLTSAIVLAVVARA